MISSLTILKAQEGDFSVIVHGYKSECLQVGGHVFPKKVLPHGLVACSTSQHLWNSRSMDNRK